MQISATPLHAEEDKKARETVEKRNSLDALILQLENTLKDNKEKLEAQEITDLQAEIEKAKAALKEHENNAEELQKAHDELIQASHKVAEKLYKQQAQPGQEASHEEAPHNDGPIDADIVE